MAPESQLAGTHDQSPARLFEREGELDRIEAAIGEMNAGTGSVLLFEGPAGIGKTALLGHTRRLAAERGAQVLAARGLWLEHDFAWSVVRQLFAQTLLGTRGDQRRALLRDAAVLARPALGLPTDGGPVPDQAGVLHGLFWLTAHLSDLAPVAIVVDDLHWADRDSLRYLTYLAPRIEGIPILIVGAIRSGEPGGPSELLGALSAEPAAEVLFPQTLSADGSERLIRSRSGRNVGTELCAWFHRQSGGNPFLLGELINEAAASRPGVTGVAGSALPRRADLQTPNRRAAPFQEIARRWLARLEHQPDARGVASAIAVLGPLATRRRVAALAAVTVEHAGQLIELMVASQLVLARDGVFEFAHPLVREVVYREIGSTTRDRLHVAAARMLSADGAAPAEIAAHLLNAAAQGDEWIVQALRRAAADAVSGGSPEVGARYLRRALDEPPTRQLRADVLFELGAAEVQFDLAAVAHLEAAIECSQDPRQRAEAGLLLGRTLGLAGHHARAAEVLEEMLEEAPADEQLSGRIAAELVGHCIHSADKLPIAYSRLAGVQFDRRPHSAAALLQQAMATFALISAAAITPARATELALDVARDPRFMTGELNSSFRFYVAETLVFADAIDQAIEVLDGLIEDARGRGSRHGIALACAFRAQACLRRGEVLEAEADARQALDAVDSQVLGYCRPYVYSFLADVLIERGQYEEADRLIALEGDPEQWPELWQYGLLLGSRGRLRLAQGRLQEGVDDLLQWGVRIRPWIPRNPASASWRSDAAVAMVQLGRHEEALRLADWELAHARSLGMARPLGNALRAAGLVRGTDTGITLLRESVDVLKSARSPLAYARALTDLGASIRRRGEAVAAREPLRLGLDHASRCGAVALARRARDELLAAGAKPRREALRGPGSLTPSELRVAQLAVDGLTNRQIAQALFVTQRTVEQHLSTAYTKLGIQSRGQLAAALGP